MLKRKRQRKTDYRKRLILLKSRKPRLVVRRTNKNIIAQATEYHDRGDRIIKGVDSRNLIKYGWDLSRKSIPAAYLTGYLLGKRMFGKTKEAVLDSGLYNPKSNKIVYSVVRGAIDAGINVECNKNKFPRENMIRGKHIKEELEKKFETVRKKIENEKG